MSAGPISRRWRRFLRFSVRGLIVVVLVIGAALGWLVRSARIQREAVAAIESTEGLVRYNWDWNDGKSIQGAKPWAPQWLVNLIGIDYFGHVTFVAFDDSSTATDATIEQVGRLTQLQWLALRLPSHSDAAMAHLKGLLNLSELHLSGTRVTDAGLGHLNGLKKLAALSLGGTQITDAGLVHLKGLTKLSFLDLNGTQVTDSGLVHLKGLNKLKALYHSDAQVTDAGVKRLKRFLPSLKIY